MNQDEDVVTLPVVYIGAEDEPILFANQFVIQHEKNEFILTVGQLNHLYCWGRLRRKRNKQKS